MCNTATRFTLSDQALERGHQQYQATMTESNRVIRDSLLTPFAMAMKLEGFEAVTHPSGCMLFRECPECRETYSTKYRKAGVIYWACPHCRDVAMDDREAIQREKRERVLAGEKVVMSNQELDGWSDAGMPLNVVSLPNPDRAGLKDVWVVYTKD
jgi:hypothetical protein|tara:strand:- start:412 stop:876 length:465 start_codon:yes stop_codon:yes gene_type:complete